MKGRILFRTLHITQLLKTINRILLLMALIETKDDKTFTLAQDKSCAFLFFCVYQSTMKIPMTKLFGIKEDTKDITLKVLYSKRPMVGTTNKGAIL